MNSLIEALEPFASPEAYGEPLEAFPHVEAEIIDGVGPALTTTPAVTTPPVSPAPSARGPRPSPPPEITRRAQFGAFTRGALAVLPLVVLGVVFLWWQGSGSEASGSDASGESPPAAVVTKPAPAPAPVVVAPEAPLPIDAPPPTLPAVAPEPRVVPSAEPAEPARRKHRDARGAAKPDEEARHPMELAEGEQHDGGVASPRSGAAPKPDDAEDSLHRAGRVKREDFGF
jgi:hypothetical protein